MARPITTPFQERLYASFEPVADQDEGLGWPLLIYCGAIAAMYDQIEEYARDSDEGDPGWSIIVDPDRVPIEAIDWLAQITGTILQNKGQNTSETSDQYLARIRQQFRAANNQKRGTIEAITSAVQQQLTGTKTIFFRERDGGAYNLTVVTLTSETPSTAAVTKAISDNKPAGIIVTYASVTGATYIVYRTTYLSYTAMRSDFTTYNGLRNNQPGT
jgi:hypothetical protein